MRVGGRCIALLGPAGKGRVPYCAALVGAWAWKLLDQAGQLDKKALDACHVCVCATSSLVWPRALLVCVRHVVINK